jgi:hypothetical protein
MLLLARLALRILLSPNSYTGTLLINLEIIILDVLISWQSPMIYMIVTLKIMRIFIDGVIVGVFNTLV